MLALGVNQSKLMHLFIIKNKFFGVKIDSLLITEFTVYHLYPFHRPYVLGEHLFHMKYVLLQGGGSAYFLRGVTFLYEICTGGVHISYEMCTGEYIFQMKYVLGSSERNRVKLFFFGRGSLSETFS